MSVEIKFIIGSIFDQDTLGLVVTAFAPKAWFSSSSMQTTVYKPQQGCLDRKPGLLPTQCTQLQY